MKDMKNPIASLFLAWVVIACIAVVLVASTVKLVNWMF